MKTSFTEELSEDGQSGHLWCFLKSPPPIAITHVAISHHAASASVRTRVPRWAPEFGQGKHNLWASMKEHCI